MELVYIFDSSRRPVSVVVNRDLGEVVGLLGELGRRGVSCSIVDVAGLDEASVRSLYYDAVGASFLSRCEIRGIFGSEERDGAFFGREIPALLIYEGGVAVDVYPHKTEFGYVTIYDCLKSMINELDKRGVCS